MADKYEDEVSGVAVVLPVFRDWAPYTALQSQGFGTLGVSGLEYRQVGNSYDIRGQFTLGTTTGVTAQLGLPNNVVVGPATVGRVPQGRWYRNTAVASTVKSGPLYCTPGASVIEFGWDDYTSAQNPFSSVFGNNVGSATNVVGIHFTGIPIVGLSTHEAYGAGQATDVKPGLITKEASGSFTAAITGPFSTSATVTYSRVGKSVTLTLPNVTGTSTSAAPFSIAVTNMPSFLNPAVQQSTYMRVTSNSVTQAGLIVVNLAPTLSVYSDVGGSNFAASGTAAFSANSITYVAAN